MLKLKRYMKPYLGLLAAAILLLFGQAMLELTLPNYMSDIVNVGLQQGGITQESAEGLAHWQKTYPNLTESDWVLAADAEDSGANRAFSRAAYALVQAAGASAMDPAALAALDQSDIDEAVNTAAVTPDSLLGLGADTDAIQTGYILSVGVRMLGLTLLLTACAISAGFCLSRLGAGVGRDLRRDVFTRVTYFNNAEMDQFSTASLITRSTNDITQVQNFLSVGLRMLCFAPIMGLGGLIMGLRKCPQLAWVLALALTLMLTLILVLFKVALPRFKKMQSLVDRLNLVSREELSGLMVVRAFANQDFMQKRFDSANKDLTGNTLFVNRAMATMLPVMTLVMNGISLLIVWFGGKQIAASSLQVGDMMAFIQYAMQVIMSFLFISLMFILVPRASVSADRICQVLDTENSVADPESPVPMNQPVKGVVEFRDVSFRYGGADADVLEHISFTARPGETTAFIGSTGSGKSTLINLIPRFYDATEGQVLIDGVDVRQLRQQDLRAAIGYVPQKGLLFSGTIASNLRTGDENANDETLRAAAAVAQATEFVDKLPGGMDAPVSQGGTNVSGGQRQRLSIARALVKKAPIYIFDATVSALDFKTDAALRTALRPWSQVASVLIVAQRVSTIMHAQQIIVLDEGRVVGKGTHEQLLRTCPEYREIAQSQLSKEELG